MTSKFLYTPSIWRRYNCHTTKVNVAGIVQASSAFKPTDINTYKCKTLTSHKWDDRGNMAEEEDLVKQGLH